MLKKLLKESFNLWCRMRWLKTIDKEVKKRDKYYEKYKRHRYIAIKLYEEYEKDFPEKREGEG